MSTQEQRRRQRRRRRRRQRRLIILAFFLVVAGAALGLGWFIVDSQAWHTCRVEAGVTVSASDFMKDGDPEAYFTEGSDAFDTTQPGEYHVVVKSGWFTHKATLIVQDTVAPAGDVVSVELLMGDICGAEDFVENLSDATDVTVEFVTAPDFTLVGEQDVEVVLTDEGGNQTVLSSTLFVRQVRSKIDWEAGSGTPTLADLVVSAREAYFDTDLEGIDWDQPGEYEVTVVADGFTYTASVNVVDTVAPVVVFQNVSGYALVEREASEFVASMEDVTALTVSFKETPDFTLVGSQSVTILVTDEGGNQTKGEVTLELVADTEAPVITGAEDIEIYAGDSVSYKANVTVTDNCEEGLELTVDNSGVNLNEAGTYEVTYIAADLAGNETRETITLTVLAREHSVDEVNALADEVLAEIITDDMEALDKVEAIYNWVTTHVGYISHSDKGDYVQAAYEGLVLHQGDCYVFASTTKVLLTRAGIENMDICKIPTSREHYWNLVNLGDGWYHLDTTPRTDHPRIFMWTDEELMAYSAEHYNSHNYDASLYPEIN